MKNIATILLTFLLASVSYSSVFAQVVLEVGDTYRIEGRIFPKQVTDTGTLVSANDATTLNPLIIYLESTKIGGDEYALFRFLEYDDSTTTEEWLGPEPETDPYIWAIEKSQLVDQVEAAYATWLDSHQVVPGVVSLPVKLRLDPFNFSGNIALGPALALRVRSSPTRDYYFAVLVSAGISSVQLTPSNTNSAVSEATDRAAYYWTGGLTAEFSGYQMGIFLGKDYINGSEQSAWEYQGDVWFSLGIGTTIFGAGSSKAPDKQ
jgi:hypothetical protein